VVEEAGGGAQWLCGRYEAAGVPPPRRPVVYYGRRHGRG
jgi:hypothetical protein